MVRFRIAGLATLLTALSMAAGAAQAQELKPKFGDIDGIFIVSLANEHERKECRRTVQRMIAHCLSNTTFISNTLNERYPDCLPVFRRQAKACAAHFRRQRYKCDGTRDIDIAGFTGFGCQATERTEAPAPKCAGMGEGAKCWLELANKPGCYVFNPNYKPPETATWSGACSGGFAAGRGTWRWRSSVGPGEATGTLVDGKLYGRWVVRWDGGRCSVLHFSHGEQKGSPSKC